MRFSHCEAAVSNTRNPERTMSLDTSTTSTSTPPWRKPGWNLSTVEARPEDATDWPDTAVERVTFTVENAQIPQGLVLPPDALPLTVYFDESGWPVGTPEAVRTAHADDFWPIGTPEAVRTAPADPLFILRAALHAWPWFARLLHADEETWRRELRAIDSAEWRGYMTWQADLLRGLGPVLPQPSHPDDEK